MQYKTLGDVVHEAIEEYHQEQNPPKGRFEKFKNSLEYIVAKHQPKILLGSAVVFGGAGWYLAQNILNYYKEFAIWGAKINISYAVAHLFESNYTAFFNKINSINTGLSYLPKFEILKPMTMILGGCLGILTGLYVGPRYTGGRIYEKIKGSKIHKKIGKVFKHPNLMAVGLTTGLLNDIVIKMPSNLVSLYNMSKIASSNMMAKRAFYIKIGLTSKDIFTYTGFFLGLSFIFKILRDIEAQGKEGWKNLGRAFITLPTRMLGAVSKDSAIKTLKRKTLNHNTFAYNYALGRAIFKKDISEGIDYCKEIIERNESELEFNTLKKWSFGLWYTSLYKNRKESWLIFFENLIKINKENKEVAERIIKKAQESTPSKKIDAHFLLNYFSERYTQEPQDKPWSNLARNIISLSKKGENIQEFRSSEGRVWVYTGSKLINRSLVLEEYNFDFFDRFLKKRFEYETLRNSETKTENPLVFMRENGKSLVLTTREGDSNLRDFLSNKSKADRRKAFERIVADALVAQKLLYEKLRLENNGFLADVNYDNRVYPIKFDVLNLEEHLLHRAFIGDERRGKRFGTNEYLPELLNVLSSYRQENYSPIIITLNHGDLFTTNLTEKYARLDHRHIIADTLFDTTYLSLDPVFLELSKDEKAEIVFKALNKISQFNDEGKFRKSFDYFYLHNGLGLTSSQKAHNEDESAAAILNEVMSFVGYNKVLADTLYLYLKNSEAQPLLKII